MTYNQTLKTDSSAWDAIADGYRKSPKLMETAVKRQLPKIRRSAIEQLQQQPPPAKKPIQWTSEKQRRAFFATNGFGRGIPYRRTGALVEAWDVVAVFTPDSGSITIENNAPSATYVIGDDQQQFHANTGWIKADDILIEEVIKAQDIIEELWITVVDESAGVR